MSRTTVTVIGIIGTVGILAGCGGAPAQPGTAPPTSDPSSASATMTAPNIPNPVDVERYRQDPCSLMPSNTLTELGLDNPQVDKAPSGGGKPAKSCHWRASDHAHGNGSLTVSLVGLSLGEQYKKQNLIHSYDYFKPTKVETYPAVYDISMKDQETGANGMIIGVNPAESVGISTHSDPDKSQQAKIIADKAAAAIVQHIQPGGK